MNFVSEEQRQLFERISAFQLNDPDSSFRFTDRLVRENGWSLDYAQRVIDEYLKFMFLAVEAGHPVTPSEQIDQVWHLHLVYTRSYWEDFCGEVVGKPIHHGPTRGGPAESDKYHDWYGKTLESYQRLFGAAPPADIWRPADARFGEDLEWRRVNLRRSWVIPKSCGVRAVVAVAVLGILAALLLREPDNVGDDMYSNISPNSIQMSSSEITLVTLSANTETNVEEEPKLTPWQESRKREEEKKKNLQIVFYVVLGVVVLGAVLFAVLIGERCPTCRRNHAMDKTGKKDGNRYEMRCRFCGNLRWKGKSSSTGGCGGCGGCGG